MHHVTATPKPKFSINSERVDNVIGVRFEHEDRSCNSRCMQRGIDRCRLAKTTAGDETDCF